MTKKFSKEISKNERKHLWATYNKERKKHKKEGTSFEKFCSFLVIVRKNIN